MPARRNPPGLKLAIDRKRLRPAAVVDAEIGGVGLDWSDVPADLDDRGSAEWSRLAAVYEDSPTRFREGDRAIVIAYCSWWSVYLRATDALAAGVTVPGRSAKDAAREVRNPATVVALQSCNQVRYLARELGLSPDSRARMGLVDDGRPAAPIDPGDPFGAAG